MLLPANNALFLLLSFFSLPTAMLGLHIRGEFQSSDFFSFLAKFGFQRTDVANSNATLGFIFGNVSLVVDDEDDDDDSGGKNDNAKDLAVTLAVLDRSYFLEYYGNRSLFDKTKACRRMFERVSDAAYDAVCQNEGQQDFLR